MGTDQLLQPCYSSHSAPPHDGCSATATAAKSTHSTLFALYRRTLTLSEHTTLIVLQRVRRAAQRSLLGPSDANASSESTSGHTSAGCRCASCVKKFAGQRHDLDRMKSERSSESCDMIDQCDYAVDGCARRHCSVARTASLVVCGSRKTSCACMLSMPGRVTREEEARACLIYLKVQRETPTQQCTITAADRQRAACSA